MNKFMHSFSHSKIGTHRLYSFLGLFILCLIVFTGLLYIAFSYSAGLILLYLPLGIGLISLIGLVIWFYLYHDWFESFLVYITLVSSLFTFLIMAPFVVERSLSCFIYFKAVEDGTVSQNSIPTSFMESFIQKRFDDGVKGGFLTQQGDTYFPTYRSKLFYTIYYPLGVLTNTLNNYHQFKASYENKNN